jgi:indole-3-glycerol phosphate synthase/phosphoribosylanthranilate isomerase
VLDNGQGGSGQRFDWSLLQGQELDNVMLAGGLGADNCVEAAKPAVPDSISIQA